jgi:hypothetical protein
MSSVPSNSSKSPLACAVPIHCNQPSLAATFSNTTRFSPALKLCTLAKSTSQRTGHIFDTVLPSAPRLDGGGGGGAAAAAAAAAPEVGGIDGDGSLSDDAGLLMMEQGQMVPALMMRRARHLLARNVCIEDDPYTPSTHTSLESPCNGGINGYFTFEHGLLQGEPFIITSKWG